MCLSRLARLFCTVGSLSLLNMTACTPNLIDLHTKWVTPFPIFVTIIPCQPPFAHVCLSVCLVSLRIIWLNPFTPLKTYHLIETANLVMASKQIPSSLFFFFLLLIQAVQTTTRNSNDTRAFFYRTNPLLVHHRPNK